MNILPINNQIFKGQGAGKIKALYMQNSNLPAQIPIYNELRNIGQKHNFDVYIHNQDEIQSGPIKYTSTKHCEYQMWAQDNQTFLNKSGKKVLVSTMYMPHTEEAAARNLAKIKDIELETPELFLQGGNFFVGKKPDGKNYLIVGWEDIEVSAIHYYLKDKLGAVFFDDMDKLIRNGKLEKNGQIIATFNECNENIETWGKIVMKKLQETFEVDKKDITIVSQGQYHNDLVIRPLNYPYVLINDEKISQENLDKLRKKFKFNTKTIFFIKDLKKKLEEQKEEYASCDEICLQLEKAGFIPIRIGGGYGVNTINFINAIVHRNGNDLIYITNSCIGAGKDYEYLQMLFEEELKEKCPQIKKIYFIGGAVTNNKSNIVLEYLKQFKGGIHCLCAEEMVE